ncbi:hypothetical protein M427DRAFT_439181 [Gonapodya prolifera JEL478]|uniref:F-box domain-containing protein n=1 Tax=Gonapodya prolifera (strain JEL478) TaxID=1344416 RepID=A0A139A3S5_GONPJ|nr:hypothetical protein M427DRAFT_439181 [Gonapodya prolifera JEL478]|eukprot:KXS11364.1 hypothetical protein M427DRAFT_439181 [Gonapodya prolifera JEL478]
MDSLPLEVLRRILLFLPPRVFYGRIPLVSRVFRENAWNALPGCPQGDIAIALGLELRDVASSGVSINDIEFSNEFNVVNHDGQQIWSAFAGLMTINIGEVHTETSLEQLANIGQQTIVRHLRGLGIPEQRMLFVFKKVLLDTFGDMSLHATNAFTSFLRIRAIPTVQIGDGSTLRFTEDHVVSSVTTLVVDFMGTDVVATFAKLLTAFPCARTFGGEGVILDAESAASLPTRVPRSRMLLVTTLIATLQIADHSLMSDSWYTSISKVTPQDRNALLVHSPQIFSNLTELGTLFIWQGLGVWEDALPSGEDCSPLPNLRTLHIYVQGVDLVAAAPNERTKFYNASTFVFILAPCLQKMTIGLGQRYPLLAGGVGGGQTSVVEDLDTVTLNFMEALFSAAVQASTLQTQDCLLEGRVRTRCRFCISFDFQSPYGLSLRNVLHSSDEDHRTLARRILDLGTVFGVEAF